MGLFDVFKTSKNVRTTTIINNNSGEYISMDKRINRYQLTSDESLINDSKEAELYEISLYNKSIELQKVNSCPYCKAILNKNLIDIKKCTSCKDKIKILKSYLVDAQVLVLTEDEYLKLKTLRSKFHFYKKISTNLYSYYDIRRDDINLFVNNLPFKPLPLDIAWGMYNQLILRYAGKRKSNENGHNTFGNLANIYRSMASIQEFEYKPQGELINILMSCYYSYLQQLDSNIVFNESNTHRGRPKEPFEPWFAPKDLKKIIRLTKGENDLIEIYNKTIPDRKYRKECLADLIEEIKKTL